MKRVATAVVLIPLVVFAVLKAPAWLFALITGVVALLATREYLSIVEGHGLKPQRACVYLLTGILFGSACMSARESGFLHPSAFEWYSPIFVFGMLVLLSLSMRQEDLGKAFLSAVAAAFALLYVSFPLLLLVEPLMPSDFISPAERAHVLFLLVTVWASDSFAYYIGRSLGRRPLAPRISPKKTVEGAVGSMVGAAVVGMLFWLATSRPWFGSEYLGSSSVRDPASVVYWISMAAFINIAAQLGDLVESMMKRGANIKDSGTILPGHGGILDRIDALLFASPAMWYYPKIFYVVKDLLFG